jgi:hypothetical protein
VGPTERTSFGLGEQVLDIAVACKIARESAVLVLHVGTRRPVVKLTEKVVVLVNTCMITKYCREGENGSVRAEKELDDFGLVTPHGLMQSGLALCMLSRTHSKDQRQVREGRT